MWKCLYTMSCLVQEPEENVNIINNYIQIMHKSTYLKTYLKKEIWSKKNGSFSSTQAPHQQVISHTKIPDKVNSSHFHFLTNGLKTVLDSASCSSPFSLWPLLHGLSKKFPLMKSRVRLLCKLLKVMNSWSKLPCLT